MFYQARRVLAGVPIASAAIGMLGQPLVLMLPPALVTLYVLVRDRVIRQRVGRAAWPSEEFARHVLVDDMCRLGCLMVLSIPLFFAGMTLRRLLGA